MKYRAVAKKVGDWWIGWLIDLPGVNAQEKSEEELMESLRIGAEDMLSAEIPFEPGAKMTTIEIPGSWLGGVTRKEKPLASFVSLWFHRIGPCTSPQNKVIITLAVIPACF